MDEQLVGILEKGKTRDLRAQLMTYHGHKYLDLRTFVVTDASDERSPTKKGVTVPIDKIPELRELLEQAEAAASEAGLLTDDAEAA
jgi:hypothetical protein